MAEKQAKKKTVESTFADAWKPEEPGAQLVGVYLGEQEVPDGKKGPFTAYHIRETSTGKLVSVSGAGIVTQMKQIPRRTEITFTYKGEVEMKRGPMRTYTIEIPDGVELLDPYAKETDDSPFRD